jgi:hypothetical protein
MRHPTTGSPGQEKSTCSPRKMWRTQYRSVQARCLTMPSGVLPDGAALVRNWPSVRPLILRRVTSSKKVQVASQQFKRVCNKA